MTVDFKKIIEDVLFWRSKKYEEYQTINRHEAAKKIFALVDVPTKTDEPDSWIKLSVDSLYNAIRKFEMDTFGKKLG